MSDKLTVLQEIAAERKRQVAKGYDAAHDDSHTKAEMFFEALSYLGARYDACHQEELTMSSPVDMSTFEGERSVFVRGIVLLVAELERIDRLLERKESEQ